MKKIHIVQLILFILTVIFTTISGAEWRYGKQLFSSVSLDLVEIYGGLAYSIPFLVFLSVHEFGHYLTAMKNQVKVTLPFYIPFYLGFIFLPSFGTIGALISIREKVKSRRTYFDIGVAGPLAGMVAALVIMAVGFSTLPPLDYLFEIHPEYISLGENYKDYRPGDGEVGQVFKFGSNLLFQLFENYFPYDVSRYPYENEIIHYPLLMVSYLALIFTSINLLPIGQLDGGHVIYGLFGKKLHGIISRVCYVAFLFYSGLGFIKPGTFDLSFFGWSLAYIYFLYVCLFNFNKERQARLLIAVAIFSSQFILSFIVPGIEGYAGWLLMALIVGRVIGIDHPGAIDENPLNLKRKIFGALAILTFVLCFTPKPIMVEEIRGENPDDDQSTSWSVREKQIEDSIEIRENI
ncbi:MAG: site-2 protease family protein [Cyclobacteriaceae bacterium]